MASLECAASSSACEPPLETRPTEEPQIKEPSPGDPCPEKTPPVEPPLSEPSAAQPYTGDLRVVLLGKTGSGRSSCGNTLLGRDAFRIGSSPCSVTARCDRTAGSISGRSLSVVDTPGFFHTRLSPREVASEAGRCVALSAPGPHALLVTLRPGRFTQEEREALGWIRATFGPGATRYVLVLFTCGDQLGGRSVDDYLSESEELRAFVGDCRGGCHVFDNGTGAAGGGQVSELLEKIDKMVAENGGGCYTCPMYRAAERAIQQAQERILGERREAPDEEAKGDRNPELQGRELERRRRREEEEERRREEGATRKKAEKLFWCELVSALGRGAAEGAGVTEKGKGRSLKKVKVVETAAALAATPLSVTAAAKVVGGAVREGSKVLYKHRKTLLH